MPAINVARTDTFEIQRQKINQIGDQIFNISQGGSDLATGNLKLGDGTISAPSLGFTTKSNLGLYKATESSIGFVSSDKRLFNIGLENLKSFRDFVFQKNVLYDAGLEILNSGSNYDPGSYTAITVSGGTGVEATADILVSEYVGEITNQGSNYNPGNYTNIELSGGSGTGSTVNFIVDPINGNIIDSGNGYQAGNYTNVPLTNGSGSGALANISIIGSAVLSGSIANPGSSYTQNTYQNVPLTNVPIQTFVVTAVSNPGTPPPDNVYQIDGVTQATLSFVVGNTYNFDVSDASVSTHPLAFSQQDNNFLPLEDFIITSYGTAGTPGAFIQVIVKPSASLGTIKYYCTAHAGMGSTISVISGSEGNYGSGSSANITVDASGNVTDLEFVSYGSGYKIGNSVTVFSGNIGGTGSGFIYTLSSIVYNGEVSSVSIVDSGLDYQNGDILSANDSDLGNVGGSGFEFFVNTDPGIVKNLSFVDKGSGYSANDVLSLPGASTNISGSLKGIVTGLTTTLTSGSSIVTLSSTSGIVEGMGVSTSIESVGTLDSNTTVLSIDSSTQITLSTPATGSGSADLSFVSPGDFTEILVNDASQIYSGYSVTVVSGDGSLDPAASVLSVDYQTNIVTINSAPISSGYVVLDFSPSYGIPTTNFEYTIGNIGAIETVTVNNPGNGYSVDDILSVLSSDLIQPITYNVSNKTVQLVTLDQTVSSSTFSVGDFIEYNSGTETATSEIYKVNSSGGNIVSLLVDGGSLSEESSFNKVGSATVYDVNTVENQYRYFIDIGNGSEITPNITLYSGNIYTFDFSDSSNSGHIFNLSTFRDGQYSPSLVDNVNATIVSGSRQITVTDTSNISVGMEVTVISGQAILQPGTVVESVDDATTLTLSLVPVSGGQSVVSFSGTAYSDNVTRTGSSLTIKITDDTPNLYYYCSSGIGHENEGGDDNEEALLTIDLNNPKVFGSGFQLRVNEILESQSIFFDIISGKLSLSDIESTDIQTNTFTASTSISTNNATVNTLNVTSISRSGNIGISATNTNISSGNFNIGSSISMNSNGNITTSGILKTTNLLNVNDKIRITDNNISTTTGNDLNLLPSPGSLTKVISTKAFVIPVGTSLERPDQLTATSGAIRFNTTTGQYEGYNSSTTTWSSLGGVRDIDGNTYILAELNPGSNDNTLWFYNDSVNTLKLTPQFLDFRSVKTISSGRLGLPSFTVWTANTPVSIGQFVKYRNNLYEVTGSGTTATVGNEPVHVSGALNNGTAQLTWYSSAVSPLTFTEIEELRVAPNKDAALVVNGGLKLGGTTSEDWNTISTLVEDLTIAPNPGKRVIIKSYTHLAIPAGNNNQKNIATAIPGSIRFNTEIQQYEGYSGTNWSSLGGVRDVDGNTYIIPESAPAANENILYFYNDNLNTMQLTKTSLDFTNIDTITTSGLNNLSIDTPLVTLNSNDTTIDNRDVDRTFISTSKQFLDLGLSSGLVVDPVLRLDDQGDVYLNTTFGSGTFNGVKVLDGQLKEFELADYAIKTTTFQLAKGGAESGSFVLYDSGSRKGCKVTVVSKSSSGKRSMTEYSVIDNGTDIFHNEFGSLNTSLDQYTASFDINATNETRISLTLSNDHANGDIITFTILVQVIK